jgi:hypothetical protein
MAMDTMTRDTIDRAGGAWAASLSADEHAHEVAFAREAVAYLRASGLPDEDIERALCDEIGLPADEAHLLALAG